MYLCSLIILPEESQCPVGVAYVLDLFYFFFYCGFSKKAMPAFNFPLNEVTSQSTQNKTKLGGLKQPPFVRSHECENLSQAQQISAGPIVLCLR